MLLLHLLSQAPLVAGGMGKSILKVILYYLPLRRWSLVPAVHLQTILTGIMQMAGGSWPC